MSSVEEQIARQMARLQASGELRRAAGYGKPVAQDHAWLATPPGLRTTFQVMKSAGVPPAEVELFQQRASLHVAIEAAVDAAERQRLRAQLAELEQNLTFRLEALRRMGEGG